MRLLLFVGDTVRVWGELTREGVYHGGTDVYLSVPLPQYAFLGGYPTCPFQETSGEQPGKSEHWSTTDWCSGICLQNLIVNYSSRRINYIVSICIPLRNSEVYTLYLLWIRFWTEYCWEVFLTSALPVFYSPHHADVDPPKRLPEDKSATWVELF